MDISKINKKLDSILDEIKFINEQPEEDDTKKEKPDKTPEEKTPIETPEPTLSPEPAEETPIDTGMNVGMGMPIEEPQAATTSTQIGRVYEMKKIFFRLTSLENFLTGSNDVELLRLRDYVKKAIDLFEVLMSNLKMFLDKIDDIIITYYKFIETVYNILKKYHDEKHDEQIKSRGGSTGY